MRQTRSHLLLCRQNPRTEHKRCISNVVLSTRKRKSTQYVLFNCVTDSRCTLANINVYKCTIFKTDLFKTTDTLLLGCYSSRPENISLSGFMGSFVDQNQSSASSNKSARSKSERLISISLYNRGYFIGTRVIVCHSERFVAIIVQSQVLNKTLLIPG